MNMTAQGPSPLLIHIGYPKAISSWLQKHFFKEKCGYTLARHQIECQLEIIRPAPFDFSPETARMSINAHITSNPGLTPVLSAEALSGNMYCGGYNSKEIADRLFSIAPEAKILIIIREQKAMIRSMYKSWVTWGVPHGITEALQPNSPDLIPQFRFEYLHFDKLIHYYQTLFGETNVLVIPYESFQSTPFIVLRKIHQFSGNKEESLPAINELPVRNMVNKGKSLTWLYWLRWQNRYIYKTAFSSFGFISLDNDRLMERIATSKKNPLPAFTEQWFEKDFKDTVSGILGNHYKQSNKQTSKLIGIDLEELGYDC